MPSRTHGPTRRAPLAALIAASWMLLCAVPAYAEPPQAEYAPGAVIVKYKPGVRVATRASMREALGAEVVAPLGLIDAELLNVRGVSVPEAVARLRLDPRVEYAEPDYIVHALRMPNDARYSEQYGLHNAGQTGGVAGADIGAEAAWDRFTGDPSVLVGVIDTGIDPMHPDLAPNLWTNPGEIPANGVDDDGNGYIDDLHGYDFVGRDGDPTDDNGHGTHIAGVIAARGDNGVGIAGVNWRLRVMAIKFLDSVGSGTSSNAVLALQYGVQMGCRLTNNSWGGGPASRAVHDAIEAAGAAGQLFVAAAGNAGSDNDAQPLFPASYGSENIVVVAATDHADQLAGFSNYGLTSVDIAAPGDGILSTWPGGGYRSLSGTSMATPHVTGAAAFLLGRFPSMTAMQAKARLMRFSRPLTGLTTRTTSGGRLDLALASADPDTLAPGAISDLRSERIGSNRIALAWTSTGDDSSAGSASLVEVRYRVGAFDPDSFATASLAGMPAPPVAGETQRFEVQGLAADTPYAFALRARDEFGNPGPVSTVLTQRTLPPPRVRITPLVFTASLSTGDSASREVELFNDSPGTYDWQAPQPQLDRIVSQPSPAWPERAGDKGVEGPIWPAQTAGEGGPDAFGYRWIDSRTRGGPAFRWADIIAPTNQLAITGDEQVSGLMPVGFTFPFYGRPYTRVRVSTNGYLSFGDNGSSFLNGGLPSLSGPRALVAPFWDDLDFGAGEKRAYAHFDGSRLVVTWADVPRYNDPGSRLTFQAILYPSGEIRFQYLRLEGQLEGATVGIQDSTRTIGLTVAYDQSYLVDSLTVRIAPEPQWLAVVPSRGEIGPGERTMVRVRFDAKGLGSGTYHGVA
ncbi:MAG: S8 family serine peptidase, partial [Candidatus Eisenbacteria bacterium]